MTAATGSAGTIPEAVSWDGADLVLTRVFRAPREVVFRAWTEPEHFARWFGPHGSTMPICRLDARAGGVIHFCHRSPRHPDVWIRGVYGEVAAPERIDFTWHFSDPAGDRVERPGFPAEMTIAVTLDEHAGGTRVTVRQSGLVRDQGEVQGWREGLDRLETLLLADA